MATFQITIDDERIEDLLHSDQGVPALLGPILNQIFDAEMSEHLRAAPREQTDRRHGYRNGSYTLQRTPRVGTLDLEVPRDREGTFQTSLFDRYQRRWRTCPSEGIGPWADADGGTVRLDPPRQENHD
ncbi:transposase [Longibacter sp.]|uniref:transposase n=1 Tax=Longibacter sp. TaxID=2045415 RepID=UPI003EBBA314